MKNLILLILLLAGIQTSNAQHFKTSYTGHSKSPCGNEEFKFSLYNEVITRTDLYYGTSVDFHSKRERTGFDKDGYYYEIWSPAFYLDLYGVDEYKKIEHYIYTVCFDKKGGNLLCIIEYNIDSNIENKKFYYTQQGRDIFCPK